MPVILGMCRKVQISCFWDYDKSNWYQYISVLLLRSHKIYDIILIVIFKLFHSSGGLICVNPIPIPFLFQCILQVHSFSFIKRTQGLGWEYWTKWQSMQSIFRKFNYTFWAHFDRCICKFKIIRFHLIKLRDLKCLQKYAIVFFLKFIV